MRNIGSVKWIKTWFIVLSGRILLFLFIYLFYFLNICTYRSELILTPVSKNSTNNIPSLSQMTRAMTTYMQKSASWICIPQSPYSPTLAPSDFLHFGPLKDALQGRPYADGDDLNHRVHEEFRPFISFMLQTYTVYRKSWKSVLIMENLCRNDLSFVEDVCEVNYNNVYNLRKKGVITFIPNL